MQELLLRLVGEADARDLTGRAGAPTPAAWVRAELNATPRAAEEAVRVAAGLRGGLAATGAALSAGGVDLAQAVVIVDTVTGLPDLPDLPAGMPAAEATVRPTSSRTWTASATLALQMAVDVVRTYTRWQRFDPLTGLQLPDVGAVVLATAARAYATPTGVQAETVDDYTVRYAGFTGWTRPEMGVLHTYRRRAADKRGVNATRGGPPCVGAVPRNDGR